MLFLVVRENNRQIKLDPIRRELQRQVRLGDTYRDKSSADTC